MFSNLTNNQTTKRNQLKSQMDDFTSFYWQGHNMFEEYGMFIINEQKGGLKFYNGPSFTNQYSKPQFQEGMNNLLGVNINTQTIELQVGIYYFTIKNYRELLKLFGPYEIGDLIFSFNPNWRYKVKLKNMTDSPRYILDSNNIPAQDKISKAFTEYYYYTEWKLTFEVQGPNCLYAVDPYEWQKDNNNNQWFLTPPSDTLDNLHEADEDIRSDLEVPLDILWSIPTASINLNQLVSISLSIQVSTMQRSSDLNTKPPLDSILLELFNITLEKLPESDIGGNYLNLHYMSEQGLLFWSIDNSTEELLTLRSSSTSGKRLIRSIKVLRYMLPADTPLNDYQLIFTPQLDNDIINIESYARTNVI